MSRRALPLLLALPGCLAMQEIDPDQPCLEAGYAIAWVTEECTGDRALANARFERFQQAYTCIPHAPADDVAAGIQPEDLYACADTIDDVSCETAETYGDDISAWMSVSEACAWVAEPAGGGR